MHLARVIGSATGTVKDPPLSGVRLLVVQPVNEKGKDAGSYEIVVDVVGAGTGDTVLVAIGSAARQPAACRGVATDATAVAIIDEVTIGK